MVSEFCLLPLLPLLSWGPAGIHRHAASFGTRKRLLALLVTEFSWGPLICGSVDGSYHSTAAPSYGCGRCGLGCRSCCRRWALSPPYIVMWPLADREFNITPAGADCRGGPPHTRAAVRPGGGAMDLVQHPGLQERLLTATVLQRILLSTRRGSRSASTAHMQYAMRERVDRRAVLAAWKLSVCFSGAVKAAKA